MIKLFSFCVQCQQETVHVLLSSVEGKFPAVCAECGQEIELTVSLSLTSDGPTFRASERNKL